MHNLERICTKAINSSLLEQSQSSTIEKQHDESIENLKHDKKNTEVIMHIVCYFLIFS
ncbi:unnamed protein product [Trichobilharzia regenti]|nr:unnamed protein product [Trichobilharzia regenti]